MMSETLHQNLQAFLDNVVNAKHQELLGMLAEDAVMEFPYHLPTTPARLVGKPEIARFFAGFGNFLVLDEIHPTTLHETTDPNVGIVEYEGRGKAVQTGRPYVQQYITVLTFLDGKIAHWKDYWNPENVLGATAPPDAAAS